MTNPALRHSLAFLLMTIAVLVLAACSPVGASGPAQTSAAPTVTVAPAPAATAAAVPATPAPTSAAPAVPAAATTAPTTAATAAPATATTAPTAPAAAAAPACTAGALTPALTEGPYYKANPPEQSSLFTAGMSGTKLTISGYVLDANCKPIAGARVDFWQADSEGQYDNAGYTLRGYQVTDAQGHYSVVTVVPGLYPGRTRHIHVKVTPPGGATLTTQLFFPNEAQNAADGIFAAQNVLSIQNGAGGEAATFNFVVKTA